MKFTLFFLASALTLFSFTFKEDKYTIDVKRSSIEWKATKVLGEHHGTIQLQSGSLHTENNQLKSGSFTADMKSVEIDEMKGNSKQNLMNHLKSGDFFSVADNPTSTFALIKVEQTAPERVNITGDLTIKGITNTIIFPATVKIQSKNIVAVAKGIKIDRTKFNIKYRSKSFFGDIGDKAIDDEFEISVNLLAKK